MPVVVPEQSAATVIDSWGEALIRLESVTKTYTMGQEKIFALKNVELDIGEGEFIAVVGPSGSGKSTLANIIGGLDTPDFGAVLVQGRNLSRLDDKSLSEYRNQEFGFVFQTFNLQPGYTALENVMLPLILNRVLPRQRRSRAEECLRAVGLGDRMRHRSNQLSGGERQRVSIARAIANNPKILIADEPTGNLDSRKGEEVVGLLGRLNKRQGITLVVITHDESVARKADRVVALHDGRIS